MDRAQIEHVVVPGTFDPVTYGHIDVIRRATRMFSRVTVCVAASAGKGGGPTFTLEERVDMIRDSLKECGIKNVKVQGFTGLLISTCRDLGAQGVVKGLRQISDFEWELQQADLYTHLAPDFESIFVMSNPEYGYISSTIVRELGSLGADVSHLVPPNVEKRIKEHYS